MALRPPALRTTWRSACSFSIRWASPTTRGFAFSGAGASNALYVDTLYFLDQATNRDSLGNPAELNISSNLVIYYAQAFMDGVSVAQKLNGKPTAISAGCLSYAGYFSSTNFVYNGVLYSFNGALAQNSQIDSNGNGIPNSVDPSPFFVSGMVNLTDYQPIIRPTRLPSRWNTVPLATNFVFYSTNNSGPFDQQLTNFISPLSYPGPMTNVTIYDQM